MRKNNDRSDRRQIMDYDTDDHTWRAASIPVERRERTETFCKRNTKSFSKLENSLVLYVPALPWPWRQRSERNLVNLQSKNAKIPTLSQYITQTHRLLTAERLWTTGGRTNLVWASVKTLLWMWIMRSPPGKYSMTKQTWSLVWKQPCRLTRNGCLDALIISKILFSLIRLRDNGSG